jgi:hypothetical protein
MDTTKNTYERLGIPKNDLTAIENQFTADYGVKPVDSLFERNTLRVDES